MNFNKALKKIIDERIPCIFISPHLDDAILSAGGLISFLAKKTDVTVATVFTKPSSAPYTLSARVFMKRCGYKNADDLFRARRLEDAAILKDLGVNYEHLGYVDATWRKKPKTNMVQRILAVLLPEFIHNYPIHRIHITSGKVSRSDGQLVRSLRRRLLKIVGDKKEFYIFCPLATNTHVDHVITHDACAAIFDDVIYWSDFPYHLESLPRPEILKNLGIEAARWNRRLRLKKGLIKGYHSQLKVTFPSGKIPVISEIYYKSVAKLDSQLSPRELITQP